jgi:hypothetical protein
MTPITDEEFDRQIDGIASGVEKSLRENSWKGYTTIAQLAYPDRIEVKGLVSEDGKVESFEILYEFGKALAVQGVAAPPAVFVTAESVTAEGKPCLFISGCTADGRRNGARIHLMQTRWRKILRPTETVRYPCRTSKFEGETSAGEVMRGLSESNGPDRAPNGVA